MRMSWWRPAQRQYHERVNRYLLGNGMHIESETFLWHCVPSRKKCGLEDQEGKWGVIIIVIGSLKDFTVLIPTILGDSGMECLVHKENSLPWKTQQWSHWTTYGLHLTPWVSSRTPNKSFILFNLVSASQRIYLVDSSNSSVF